MPLEVYRVKERKRAKTSGLNVRWVIIEQPFIAVKNEIVNKNLRMLSGDKWNGAWGRGSAGGNAGNGHCCVNAVADKITGEIMMFSNRPKDYANRDCGCIRFLVDVSAIPKNIIDQITFEGEFTEEAKQNIVSAVEMKNAGN